MDIFVSSLDETFNRRNVKIIRQQIRTFTQLKKKLAGPLGLEELGFDIVKPGVAELAQYNEEISDADLPDIQIVVHPTEREVPDHLQTDEPDLINGPMETDPRAIMSCGHGIAPENLYDYCWNMLRQRKLKFTCPAIESHDLRRPTTCDAEWSLFEVNIKAKLSADERMLFEMKLNHNHWQEQQGIQECPDCHTVCERLSSTNDRVICMVCCQNGKPQYEFCWQCLGTWKTDHAEYCGNIQCATAKGPKAIQEILQTCQKKTIDQYANCPLVRICPNCNALIEHMQGCKRMTCKCKFQFCFVCLKKWDNGCGYNKTCSEVASCQNVQ